jgi:hypothetical protein
VIAAHRVHGDDRPIAPDRRLLLRRRMLLIGRLPRAVAGGQPGTASVRAMASGQGGEFRWSAAARMA